MTAAEFELAKRVAEELPLPLGAGAAAPPRGERPGPDRPAAHPCWRWRASRRRSLPRFSQPRTELPTLIVLLDISGSMDRYARLMLHYVHGLTRRHLKVHTLTFGTRLTNITRSLRNRDPDVALALAAAQVQDWKGGTRIASCLDDFNRHWARRLLGANAAVLLVSDGLDTRRARRAEPGREAASAPTRTRSSGSTPCCASTASSRASAGIRAILPHVDRFLPVHNLASLADLAVALRAPQNARVLAHPAHGLAPRGLTGKSNHGTARRPPHSRARRHSPGRRSTIPRR